MATSPLFGWEEPDDTDLVKDGAAAIRTLGNAIDTSMGDLLGGTTGQILSKASNTNMDFTWVAQDDSNAIQNAIVDAKGDLIAASAADTPARLAVGNNGETLVADSSTSTGLRYTAGNPITNPVLNSCFDIWQRGTSILATPSVNAYQADRWQGYSVSSNITVSRQATGDTTNLPFIQYCARSQRTAGNTSTGNFALSQSFESANSIPYAGKTVTLSFYGRAGANYSAASSLLKVEINTGTGTDQNLQSGYTGVSQPLNQNATLTTTWQRFTYTTTLAATATELAIGFTFTPTGTAGANDWFEVTGVQLDIGSVALPVRRNGATIQGELAACQRYYWRAGGDAAYQVLASGGITESLNVLFPLPNPVTMRIAPTSVDYSTLMTYDGVTVVSLSSLALGLSSRWVSRVNVTPASSPTNYRIYQLFTNNSTSGYIGFSAEL